MTDVGIGTAIIAYIEPHAGEAQAFNRWYERDHMYAATTGGPGAFSGARWVATRDCKAVRPPGANWFGDPARGTFLTTVWLLDGSQAEWNDWVTRQMAELRTQADRMFAGRDHLHTAVYRFRGEHRVPGGVSSATALDHPHRGVVMLAVGAGGGEDAIAAIAGDEIPVVSLFTRELLLLGDADPPEHDLLLGFTPGDPIDAWRARVAPALGSPPEVGFGSPFLRTIPGTDTYVDEI